MDLLGDMKFKQIEMNMTPMIDCVFLLIVFFIMVTEFARVERKELELPKSAEAKIDQVVPTRLVVNIVYNQTGEPDYHVGAVPVTIDEMVALLKEQKAKLAERGLASELEVRIRGDRKLQWRHVYHVIHGCSRAGVYKVNMAAEPGG